MEQKIELFGKILEIDEGRLLDMNLHYEMIQKAERGSGAVKEIIKKSKTIDEFLSTFHSLAPLIYKSLAEESVEYLAKLDVHGVDPLDFVKCDGESILFGELLELEKTFSEIRKQYNIDKDVEKEFAKSLKSTEFMSRYAQNAFMDIYGWIPKMEEYIRYDGEYIVEVSVEDEEKAVGLFEGLQNKERSLNERYILAFDMFNLDPTEREYYEYCIAEFPEQIEGLVRLYRLAGYEFENNALQKALETIFTKRPHETEEELKALKNELEKICCSIGLKNSDTVNKIDKMLTDIDIQERTFENILFESREEKVRAQKDYSEIEVFCGQIDVMSEEDCNLNKQKISNGEYNSEIKKMFINKLDARIQTIWEGEDDSRCKEIFFNTDITNVGNVKSSIQEMESIGKTDRKNRYILALNSIDNNSTELVKEYRAMEETSFAKKYGFPMLLLLVGILLISSIGILLVGIGGYLLYKKHKHIKDITQEWNVLTVDGTAIHPMLLNGDCIVKSVPVLGDANKCPSCGKTVLETDKFCRYCGYKIKEN